ncbi:MAG: LON peptidase substrate-binding domain-containing protein [Rubricoccaceae bacterium]
MPEDQRLPLFPLGIVLLPQEPVPLHIFEPRYKEMIGRCLDEDIPFGILYASETALAEVGCTARVRRVITRYADGRMDIVVVGEKRFRTLAIHRDLAYLTADVVDVAEPAAAAPEASALRTRVIAQHMRLLEMAGEPLRPEHYDTFAHTSYFVGRNAGLEHDQKQHLLELPTEAERLGFLAAHLQRMLARVERVRQLHDLARGDGHTGDPPTP